ncbi:MAG: glycosyltransferase [Halofilum sp. (in: g-proteobacteria)]
MSTTRPDVSILAPLKAWGGLERKFLILCDEFLRVGVQPELVQLRGGGKPYPELLPANVGYYDLGSRSKRDGVPQFARYLKERRPRVVLTAKDHAAQVALLGRALARDATPIFVKLTNMPSVVIRRRVQRFAARRLYRRADGVVAISEGVAQDARDFLGVDSSRLHLIYNPMVTRDFETRLRGSLEHPWFEPARDHAVLVAAGRLAQQKDFATLINAFSRLHNPSAVRLVILGEGIERARLEDQARQLGVDAYIDLPGVVEDPVPYMKAADVFVLSSRYEGLGNVLVEALASGTRLVATDCPSGPREILRDGRYGRLVPPGDSDSLGRAIEAALTEPRPDGSTIDDAVERFKAAEVAAEYLRVLGLATA